MISFSRSRVNEISAETNFYNDMAKWVFMILIWILKILQQKTLLELMMLKERVKFVQWLEFISNSEDATCQFSIGNLGNISSSLTGSVCQWTLPSGGSGSTERLIIPFRSCTCFRYMTLEVL